MWIFGAVAMIVTQPLVGMILPIRGFLYTRNMIYYVLYVWSKRHPTANASIWGFPVKAIYLPFTYVLISIFIGAPYMDMVHGILIGHIYYFLVDVVPHVYGKEILHTPQFLIDQFGVGIYQPTAAPEPPAADGGTGFAGGTPQQPQAQPRGGGHNWGGGGRRLGSN
jgi:Derlin-2/3